MFIPWLIFFVWISLIFSYGVRAFFFRYPITAATWEPEESMGNLAVLIKRFNQDVMEEGLDPNKNDMILLNEAVLGGWLESDSEDS